MTGTTSAPGGTTAGAPVRLVDLHDALAASLTQPAQDWLFGSMRGIRGNPDECAVRYAGAARRCGRGPLPGAAGAVGAVGAVGVAGWQVDEAARALLLSAVSPARRWAVVTDVYAHGDPAERRAALKALAVLADDDSGLALVEDAVRTNDSTLIEAALGPYAARYLPQPALRQAVLKCAFNSVPFARIPEILARVDDELVDLLIDFVQERILAGREVDDQILDVIATRPQRLRAADLGAQLDSPMPFRAAAARRVADYLAAAHRAEP